MASPDRTTPHTCKGSLAIAEQTIEDCWDDPETAAMVLLFAALLTGLKGGLDLGDMARRMLAMDEAGRTLLGMTDHGDWRVN